MSTEKQIKTELRLQQLISGESDAEQSRQLLRLIVKDESALALLRRMLLCQDASRKAFDLEHRGEAPAELIQTVRSAAENDGTRTNPRRRMKSGVTKWIWRIAAAAVVVASAAIAIQTRRDNTQLQAQLDEARQDYSRPVAVTQQELANYRRIWKELAGHEHQPQPLIFLHEDTGRLEYLSQLQGEQPGEPLVIRCWVLGEDGQLLEQMNLLMTGRDGASFSLADSSLLKGKPVSYTLSTEDRWISLGLDVGDGGMGPVGVGGRVRLGEDASEIGRFRLDGHGLRVFVQAVPLG